jgi:hypothetical protein
MSNCHDRGRGHQSTRIRQVRVAVIIIATAGLALLATACSSGGSSNNAAASASASTAVAYAQCMRSHGMPNYPDPGGNGQLPKETAQQLGVSNSVLQAGQVACANLQPNYSSGSSQTKEQQVLANGVRLAECMRSDGVPNFPDPTIGSNGTPRFVVNPSAIGVDPNNSAQVAQIWAKAHACENKLPAGTQFPSLTVTS